MASFNFTLGSISENVLEQQKRTSSLSHYEAIARYIAAQHIPVLSYFIVGLEGDSKCHAVNTLAFLSRLPTTVGISMFYAVPGIYGLRNLEKFDAIAPCLCNGSSAFQWNGTLTTEELITILRLSRYINLIKSDNKSSVESQLIEKIKSEQRLFTLVKNRRGVSIVDVPHHDRSMVRLLLQKIKQEA